MDDERRRAHAGAIYRAALAAADPLEAVRLRLASLGGERVIVAALGKASIAMALGARAALGSRIVRALAVTNEIRAAAGVEVLCGDHPLPGAASEAAGRALLALAKSCDRDAVFLALVSGGASALAEVAAPPLSLADLVTTSALLLASGAPIEEINVVRKHLSALKGGRLAEAAHPARVVTLVLSDVIGGTLADVGSGPTLPDASTRADAAEVLRRHRLVDVVPPRVRAFLDDPSVRGTAKPGDAAFSADEAYLVGDDRLAATAAAQAARALGYRARVHTASLRGDAREAAAAVVALALEARGEGPACIVLAGETTFAVRGTGRGGRAQTIALTAALALVGTPGITIAALATDGIDGPTDAAGAIVDGRTASRARAGGVDGDAALANDDAYAALDAAGALVRTGPSGTNVNDLVLALVD